MSRVAVIGTGRMGGAMVSRLCQAGHDVRVYNRTHAKAMAVAAATGAVVAPTPRETVAGAAVVVVSLADDDVVRLIYADLVAGLAPGAVVVETSTIHPETVRTMATAVTDRGADLIDCPVSGSVQLAERGKLTAIVGGPAEALERARPALATFAGRIMHLGELGAGATMKLAVNSVVHALNLALAEALVLAERAGVDRERAYEVFATSAVAAPFVHYKREAFVHPGQARVAFALDLVAKDLRLIDELAAGAGARMDQMAATRAVVNEACAGGYGERDLSALAELLRSRPQ